MRSSIAALVVACIASCNGAPPEPRMPVKSEARQQVDRSGEDEDSSITGAMPSCAHDTADVKVGTQLTERGAALVFTTSDDVTTLRRRAADFMMLSAPSSGSGPRTDNIRHGVRFVFEVDPPADVRSVRREILERARQISKRCNLVLAAPLEGPETEPREPDRAPAAATRTSSPKHTPKPVEHRATANETIENKHSKSTKEAGTKPKPKPKPKPEPTKPTPQQPKPDRRPKPDKKPSLPRLPGTHPEPLPS